MEARYKKMNILSNESLFFRTLVSFQNSFSQATGLGRDLDELVVGDEFEGAFERHFAHRSAL